MNSAACFLRRRALQLAVLYNLPESAWSSYRRMQVAHSFIDVSSKFSRMDSFSLWDMFFLILCVGASAPRITFVKGITIPMIVFITTIEVIRWRFRPPLPRACTYRCWWAQRWVLLGPYLLPGILLPPIALNRQSGRSFVFPPLRRVGSVQNWVTWNLGSWLTCHTNRYHGQHVGSTRLLSVLSSRIMCVVTNVDDWGRSLSSNSQGHYYAPLVYYHPFLTDGDGLSGALMCPMTVFVSGHLVPLLCCLFLIMTTYVVMF